MSSTPISKVVLFYVLAYALRAKHGNRLAPSSGSKVFNQVESTGITMRDIMILEGYQPMKREQAVLPHELLDWDIGHKS